MSYYDDDFSDDLDEFDYAAASKAKKQQPKKKSERPTPVAVNPDQQTVVAAQVPKLSTSASQRHLTDLAAIFAERQRENVTALKDLPQHINVITMGNVDAGKSTVFGHLNYLLEKYDKRELEKCEKQAELNNKASFKYAYFLDTDQQERERGVTIAVNTYVMEIEGTQFLMQDCPGHQDFSDQICSSILQPDVGVLVVEAHQFERLQETIKDQLNLMLIFDPSYLIIVVNKMDLVDFNKNVYKQICNSLKDMLKSMSVFKLNCNVSFIPCAGLDEVHNNLVEYSPKMPYAGSTLKQALITTKAKPLDLKRLDPMLIVLDTAVLDGKISATVYVAEGHLLLDDVVYVTPSNLVFEVLKISKIDGTDLTEAIQYQTVALTLGIYQKQAQSLHIGFSPEEVLKVKSGSIMCLLGQFLQTQKDACPLSKRIRAKVICTDGKGICTGEEFDAFVGLQRVEVRVNKIDAILEGTKFIVRGQYVGKGKIGVLDLVFQEPVTVSREGVLRRVVLRRGSAIAGMGFTEAWQE